MHPKGLEACSPFCVLEKYLACRWCVNWVVKLERFCSEVEVLELQLSLFIEVKNKNTAKG